MKYEKGDRLLCKKNCTNTFIKNKSYEIGIMSNHDMVIRGIKNLVYSFKDDNEWLFVIGGSQFPRHKLFEYFYTASEIRKLKLDKLNEKS